jgi:hypothetical protein
MPLFEAFYILVLDEIRAQPNLETELRWLETTLDISEKVIDVLIEILDQGDWQLKLAATGFKGLKRFNLPIASFARHLGDWHSWKIKDKTANYESLCRSALLNLAWKKIDIAEGKVNDAKLIYDDWAFAHHVYGLLRGLQENRDSARFELGLALQREPSDLVKHRIERAIRLLS